MTKHLINAIESGNVNLMLQLIRESRYRNGDLSRENLLSERNYLNESPLMCAIKNRYTDVALHLIKIDKKLNYQVPDTGDTAMMYAARRGHKEILIELLKQGASANILNNNRQTAGDLTLLQMLEQDLREFNLQEYDDEKEFNITKPKSKSIFLSPPVADYSDEVASASDVADLSSKSPENAYYQDDEDENVVLNDNAVNLIKNPKIAIEPGEIMNAPFSDLMDNMISPSSVDQQAFRLNLNLPILSIDSMPPVANYDDTIGLAGDNKDNDDS